VTKNHLRGPRFRRVFPDVYVRGETTDDLALRSRAAFQLVGASGGVLAGYSAAELLGADCAPRGVPAEVLVERKYRRRPGLRVSYGRVAPVDIVEVDRCRVTSPLRTAWDLARRLDLVDAVVAVDALARRGGFAPAALLSRRDAQPGARACRRLAEVVAVADPRAESPMETRLRLRLVRAGLPRPDVQYRVMNEHGFVLARVDLAYPSARLAIEYDGSEHYTRRRREMDRQRDAELADYGWHTMRLGRDEVDAAVTVRRVRELIALRTQGPMALPGMST
jgi:very-short-patch-repair endonuclease